MLTPSTRGVRLALVGVGLLALLAIVAVASRGGFGHATATSASGSFTSYAMSVFLVVFFASAPFALYVFAMQQREALASGRKSFGRRTAESLFAFLLVCLAIYGLWHLHATHALFEHVTRAAQHGHARLPHVKRPHGRQQVDQAHFEWPVLWAALVLAAAVVAVAIARRRRAVPPAPAEPTVAQDLAGEIGDAIGDLEAEPDARRAVIAAYARMEAALARHGLQRRRSQTPLEYLRRVLGELSGRGDAVRRLTDLFAEAKFSTHPVDGSMKRDAIDALRSIREGLT